MTQTQTHPQAPTKVRLDLDSQSLAETYERVSTRQFDHGKLLIADLRVSPGEQVLDVGCGTGRLGVHVADRVAPSGRVIGVDPLPLRIDIAARRHPNFEAHVGRAEDLSQFSDESFHVVYLNSVFHWVEDKQTALREAFRVLRPGGRLGVNSADAERLHQSATLVREAVLEEELAHAAPNALGTNHRIGASEFRALLTQAGFRDVALSARTFVDRIADVEDLVAWTKSSSFGNFLSDLDDEQLARVKRRITHKLECFRSGDAFQLERYLVFAVAKKP